MRGLAAGIASNVVNMATARPRRSVIRRWLGRRPQLALIVFQCLIPVVELGAHVAGSYFSQRMKPAETPGNNLPTGSIVFVPYFGDECRLRFIHNATWHVVDKGTM